MSEGICAADNTTSFPSEQQVCARFDLDAYALSWLSFLMPYLSSLLQPSLPWHVAWWALRYWKELSGAGGECSCRPRWLACCAIMLCHVLAVYGGKLTVFFSAIIAAWFFAWFQWSSKTKTVNRLLASHEKHLDIIRKGDLERQEMQRQADLKQQEMQRQADLKQQEMQGLIDVAQRSAEMLRQALDLVYNSEWKAYANILARFPQGSSPEAAPRPASRVSTEGHVEDD